MSLDPAGAPVIVGAGIAGLMTALRARAAAGRPARRRRRWRRGLDASGRRAGSPPRIGEGDESGAARRRHAGRRRWALRRRRSSARFARAAPDGDRDARAPRRPLRPRRRTAASRSASRPRTADAASSMSAATARGASSCARSSPPCARHAVDHRFSRAARRAGSLDRRSRRRGVLAIGPGRARLLPTGSVVIATGGIGGLFAETHQSARQLRPGRGACRARRRGARRHGVRPVPSDRARRRGSADAARQRSRARRRRDADRRDAASGSWRATPAPSSRRATSSRARCGAMRAPAIASFSTRARHWGELRGALPDHRRGAAAPRASIPRASRSRCGRRSTITWAASRWTPRVAARSRDLWACGEAACDRTARRQSPRQQFTDRGGGDGAASCADDIAGRARRTAARAATGGAAARTRRGARCDPVARERRA